MGLNLQDLDLLQEDIFAWAKRNFPDADATQELLGVVEEVGELTHAHLKNMQSIRGMDDMDAFHEARVDAVGDILVYLMNYCSFAGINFRGALEQTWVAVSKRDWIADPLRAGEPETANADS